MGHLTFPQLRLPPKVNTPTRMGQCGNEAPIQARFDMPVPVQGDFDSSQPCRDAFATALPP